MTAVSKADYLKKYLSGNSASSDVKKKKKAKTKSTTQQKRFDFQLSPVYKVSIAEFVSWTKI
jgi:hypothetical protein